VLLVTSALLAAAALLPAPTDRAATANSPGGAIVAPRGSGLVTFDAATGAEQPAAVMPPVGVTGHAAWSPDGARVAISRFGRRPGERVGGSDLLVVDAAGGPATPAVEHDREGALLGGPIWTRDGAGLFYDYLPPNGGILDSRVEFAAVDGTGRRTVAEPGAWPALSPDGRTLLYVRPTPATGDLDELVALPLDGGPIQVIVPSGQFVQIVSPRFSPDGRRIGFIGSISRGEARLPSGALASLLRLGPRAHGPPGDVWLLEPDGSAPWQRTAFEEDEPTLAWSPDGDWLAMLAGGGLYLIDLAGGTPARLLAHGGFGSIDWR
jgi:Tol biopolymer transport system component